MNCPKSIRRLLILIGSAVLSSSVISAPAAAGDPRAGLLWHAPRCAEVTSDGSLTFTRNGGRTLAPTTGSMRPVTYIQGVEALARPNQLLAVDAKGRLSRSRDAGCTWELFATLPRQDDGNWSINPVIDGSAYVWDFRGDRVFRVDGTTISERPAFDATRLGGLLTLTVDRWQPWHLRAVTQRGYVLDSRDGGKSFRTVGSKAPIDDTLVYDAKITPSWPDHIMIGTSKVGGYTSFDGGRSWRRMRIGEPGDKVNGFTVALSPVDPRIVFIQGLNVTEDEEGAPHWGRHLYRSTDGGQSFRPVIDQGGQVRITNGGLVKPSPWNRDLVYFEFSHRQVGTYLYAFNTRTGKLSINHHRYDGIKSIAFSPGAREVMYLGLIDEPDGQRTSKASQHNG